MLLLDDLLQETKHGGGDDLQYIMKHLQHPPDVGDQSPGVVLGHRVEVSAASLTIAHDSFRKVDLSSDSLFGSSCFVNLAKTTLFK